MIIKIVFAAILFFWPHFHSNVYYFAFEFIVLNVVVRFFAFKAIGLPLLEEECEWEPDRAGDRESEEVANASRNMHYAYNNVENYTNVKLESKSGLI